MQKALFILTLGVVLLLGFFITLSLFIKQRRNISFLELYLQKLKKNEDLDYLERYATKAQYLAGYSALISYKPAYKNYYIENYHIITNTVRNLTALRGVCLDDLHYVYATLNSAIGESTEVLNKHKSNLYNPFIWLKESCNILLSLIPFILKSVGILSQNNYNKYTNSKSFDVIVGVFTIIYSIFAILEIIGFF